MKEQLYTLFVIIFFSLFFGCEKEELKSLPEPDYPTTYHVLSQNEWDNLNSGFQKLNVSDSLFLNEYGFMQGTFVYEKENERLVADLVITIVDSILERYGKYLGIEDHTSINVGEQLLGYDYSNMHGRSTIISNYFEGVHHYEETLRSLYNINEPILEHYFYLIQNQIQEHTINESRIYFIFNETQLNVEIIGHWFSEVFVPRDEIYSESEGVEIAFKFADNELKENGNWPGYVSKSRYSIEKLFVPVLNDLGIELPECWYLYIPIYASAEIEEMELHYHHYEIYVDTQTGEVVDSKIVSDYPY